MQVYKREEIIAHLFEIFWCKIIYTRGLSNSEKKFKYKFESNDLNHKSQSKMVEFESSSFSGS